MWSLHASVLKIGFVILRHFLFLEDFVGVHIAERKYMWIQLFSVPLSDIQDGRNAESELNIQVMVVYLNLWLLYRFWVPQLPRGLYL